MSGLLADRAIRRHGHGVAWLVAIARCRRVLDETNVVGEHVPCDSSGWILIAPVLIVHSERHACSDRHVAECDLIAIRWNRLERNRGEAAPAWMRMRRAHARGTRLR